MNNDEIAIHKYYAPFLSSNNHSDASSRSRYDSEKRRDCCHKKLYSLLNKSKSLEWKVSLLFLILNDKKLSSHTTQIS